MFMLAPANTKTPFGGIARSLLPIVPVLPFGGNSASNTPKKCCPRVAHKLVKTDLRWQFEQTNGLVTPRSFVFHFSHFFLFFALDSRLHGTLPFGFESLLRHKDALDDEVIFWRDNKPSFAAARFYAAILSCVSTQSLTAPCPDAALVNRFGFSMSIAGLSADGATWAYRMVVVMLECPSNA